MTLYALQEPEVPRWPEYVGLRERPGCGCMVEYCVGIVRYERVVAGGECVVYGRRGVVHGSFKICGLWYVCGWL